MCCSFVTVYYIGHPPGVQLEGTVATVFRISGLDARVIAKTGQREAKRAARGRISCFQAVFFLYNSIHSNEKRLSKHHEGEAVIMDIKDAIKARHSVRQYKTDPISEEPRQNLEDLIAECNRESGLHMQLITDDPECFNSFLAHYGKFRNARNYIAIVGRKDLSDFEEKSGYYGQKIVLEAQMMGLNTCWVAGTYSRGKCSADKNAGEKIVCVIAIGYGENDGVKHKSKPLAKLCSVAEADMPGWFRNGVKAAMMAPTAINQQKFRISLDGEKALITAGKGPLTKIDLGIVKYNFEAASGHSCR